MVCRAVGWPRCTRLGCGSGYWLSSYKQLAKSVAGVEPDGSLLPLAVARDASIRVLHGSAEHIPLPDAAVDVVHARFAYFFPPGCDAGLAEVIRVLGPGGTLLLIAHDEGDSAIVGMAAYSYLWPAVGTTRSLYLKELYVLKARRRDGVGRLLMDGLLRLADKSGSSRVEWTTDRGNHGALQFYAAVRASVADGKLFYRVDTARTVSAG